MTKTRNLFLIPIVLLACAGCSIDGIYSTKQRVELKVFDRATGDPTAVSIALGRSREQLDLVEREAKLNLGISDAKGIAAFDVDTTVIVGGLFAKSEFGVFTGELDDRVSSQHYFARVRSTVHEEEVIQLQMTMNERAEGKRYTIEVVSIGKPERR